MALPLTLQQKRDRPANANAIFQFLTLRLSCGAIDRVKVYLMRSYNSDRCWPRTQKTHAHEQTAQRSKSSSINDEARLLSTPLPQCGGVIYYHLPKASGATIECFLGAQPEFSCCYRANCGLCRSWKARLSEPSSSVCQHRGLLPETIPGWREHRTQPAGQSRAGHAFVLPDALIKLSSEHASSTSADWWNASSVMRSLRFVATHHLGPDRATPGMHLNSRVPAGPGVLPAAFVRDALLGTTLPASCRIILVTVLRHPVAQLISAWHYTHRREPLASFAQRHSSTLLGVVANGLQLKPSLLSSHPRHAAFVRYVRRMASQRPSAGLDTLLSFFDGACVPLGVPRPGHTGIGSWSAYPHTIYIRHARALSLPYHSDACSLAIQVYAPRRVASRLSSSFCPAQLSVTSSGLTRRYCCSSTLQASKRHSPALTSGTAAATIATTPRSGSSSPRYCVHQG